MLKSNNKNNKNWLESRDWRFDNQVL